MAKLIYFMPTSLDGYIADETGNPDWSAPDEEAFAFINAHFAIAFQSLFGGGTGEMRLTEAEHTATRGVANEQRQTCN